jgi:lipooligosaccharide transport system permease protein
VTAVSWWQTFADISPRALRVWQRNADVFRATILVNFLPPMLEPVFYIVAFGYGFGSLVKTVPYLGKEIPYLSFMVPGVISIAVMFQAYFETTYSSFVRMYYQRTFDAITATPLLVEDVIAGEWLWGATKSVAASVIMLVMISFFGQVHWPTGLMVVPLALLGGLLFSALGLVTTALVPQIDNFNISTFLVIFPMFLFSGTFFPLEILPGWAMKIALILPLTHISSLVRGACLGQEPPYAGASVAYLLVFTAGAFAGALQLMRRRLVK